VPPEDALTRAMSVLSQKEDPLIPVNVLRRRLCGDRRVLVGAMDLNAGQRPTTAAAMRQMFRESAIMRILPKSWLRSRRRSHRRRARSFFASRRKSCRIKPGLTYPT